MQQYNPYATLQQYWGHSDFRSGQLDIINAALSNKDCVGILSTGAGKSICYQVPAMLLEGTCIVVTPLIALMHDQVRTLHKKEISAVALAGAIPRYEYEQHLRNMQQGVYKFVFVSPERCKSELFRSYLEDTKVCLLAIDEAHCISQWGYDFRPPYLLLSELKQFVNDVPTMALTASATEPVQTDIIQLLELKNPVLVKGSVFRPTLNIACVQVQNKFHYLEKLVKRIHGSTLVYCRNRGTCVKVAQFLNQQGFSASYYHAGLTAQQRTQAQTDWQRDNVPIMCCTNAFGMGIDKADVRLVVHFDPPSNIEAYYQEIGRAARDGKDAYTVLMYQATEFGDIDYQVDRKYPPSLLLREVYQKVCNYLLIGYDEGEMQNYSFDIVHCASTLDLDVIVLTNCLKLFEQQGLMQFSEQLLMPSQVHILANRDELERLDEQSAQVAATARAILRLYAGVFYEHVFINEQKIAQVAELDLNQTKWCLDYLHQQEYISYKPQTDKPQLIMLTERLRDYDLHFNEQQLAFLRNTFRNGLEKAYAYYLNTTECRSRIIAHYFGEELLANCDKCDNCLRNKKTVIKQDIFDNLQSQILSLLVEHSLPVAEIVSQIPQADATNIYKAIQALLENDKILYKADGCLALRHE